MKKIFSLFLGAFILLLTGCYDYTQEVTINTDGSGTIAFTNDISALMAVAKQMGGKEVSKMEEMAIDTSFSMKAAADSMRDLTAEEREMIGRGESHMKMDFKAEKFITKLKFPFKSPAEISLYAKLSNKVMSQTSMDALGDNDSPIKEQVGEPSFMDDYFVTEYSNGLVVKRLNKEKYAGAADDKYLKSMQEAGAAGLTLTSTLVINLPRPATKVEGKNLKLSDDKKKVTIKTDIDDFFEDPSTMEFRIEY